MLAALTASPARAACRYSSHFRVVPTLFSSRFKSDDPEVRSSVTEDDVDPMEVFDLIDTNGDGVLSKEEFANAVDQMHYNDLLKIKHSLARNELSFNPEAKEELLEETTHESIIMRRIGVTAEVAVSKIFPAGFGWQTAATYAESLGMQSTDLSFYVTTGIGDGICVLLGHTLWMAGKKVVTGNDNICIRHQSQTGLLLGSAAFCSGGVWQPVVNAMQAANWSFEASLAGTFGACSLAFFTGLRLGRLAYSTAMKGVDENNYANLKADAALSMAVGGAAGCFLGTDVSYGASNWLSPVVGIQEFHAPLTASVLAGSSTALGFSVVQMGENLVYPQDKCWVD